VKYLKGYLTVKISGIYLEKFLNMSVANGIVFWDVKRLSMTELELKLSIKSLKRLRKLLGKTGCQLNIISKNGIPFSVFKVKKRLMLGIGFAVFILLIFMLSSFVWSVKITGAKTLSIKEIEKNLSELGVRPGMYKPLISVSEVENNMLIKMDNISWIKVKLMGTRAEVEIVERTSPPEVVLQDKPCNVTARCDGIIVKIVSAQGDVVVSPGEPVRKGQLLVSGTIERPNSETRYVHSSADVTARTWIEREIVVPLEGITKTRTGNKKTSIYLVTGNKRYTLRKANVPYKDYEKNERVIKIVDTDKFMLPLQIVAEEYYEVYNKTVHLTQDQAKARAMDEADKLIIDNILPDAKIIDKKINMSLKNNSIVASISVETVEDIGMQVEIK
jgi:sporulation protein YqfD